MAKWLRHHLYIAASAVRAWRFRRKGMRIGRWCKISGSAKLDMTHPRGVVVGDYVAEGATVVPGAASALAAAAGARAEVIR